MGTALKMAKITVTKREMESEEKFLRERPSISGVTPSHAVLAELSRRFGEVMLESQGTVGSTVWPGGWQKLIRTAPAGGAVSNLVEPLLPLKTDS
jgi:hypothetical protein